MFGDCVMEKPEQTDELIELVWLECLDDGEFVGGVVQECGVHLLQSGLGERDEHSSSVGLARLIA